ncbi:MAG: hypothetical protein HOH95_12760 [Dehalococcoidia bacterium]|jgi:ABC-2 type transport system permease protein|nr:hypothetical protein [Dehalococcoidia bacterium]
MNLWRLEWLRLRRTWRGPALLIVFLLFGFTGPPTARYLAEILDSFGGGEMQVIVADPRPVDGMTQYLGNVHQLGLVTLIVVAASALAFDASVDVSTFLRTRVSSIRVLVLSRFAAYTAAGTVAFMLGALAAWYETVVLLGPLPVAGMIAGMILGGAYYGFVVSLVALSAGLARSALATTAIGFAFAVVEQIVWGLVPPLERWLPARLAFALSDLAEGEAIGDYALTLASTVAITGLILVGAIRLIERREV